MKGKNASKLPFNRHDKAKNVSTDKLPAKD